MHFTANMIEGFSNSLTAFISDIAVALVFAFSLILCLAFSFWIMPSETRASKEAKQ